MDQRFYLDHTINATTRIVYLIMDGLGGYRSADRGSELMESSHPGLDQLAARSACGLLDPVAPGVTPGSGPGHLGLFGYDPEMYGLGRGALSAAGLGVDLKPGEVAARANFATLGDDGSVVDRRAGRIASEAAAQLCERISSEVSLTGASFELIPEKEHRALLVLRGPGLSPEVSDTDPQQVGVAPLIPRALLLEAKATAELVEDFDLQCRRVLARESANALLLRGFDTHRELPSFAERYKLSAIAIASYPMYIGISRILGMRAPPPHDGLEHQLETLSAHWRDHDFFYFHVKGTDSAGEDGDFSRKCEAIEEVDRLVVPRILALDPDVLVVSADHATPTQMAAHSWHPVPAILYAKGGLVDTCESFDEEACREGALGRTRSKDLMPQVLSAAGRLKKFGA
jgi:2,3-bisphosphoglycerate-independent phosphoglycerate mutase